MQWSSLAGIESLFDHVSDAMRGDPPLSYEVPLPDEIRDRINETVESVSALGALVVEMPSGIPSVSLDIRSDIDFQSVEIRMNRLVEEIDDREWRMVEQPLGTRTHVHHEVQSRINGLDVVGPGGRYLRNMIGSVAMFGLSAHPRGQAFAAPWRHVDRISDYVASQLRDLPDDPDLKVASGYFESPMADVATHLRPVIVVVAQSMRTADDGLPWRVTVVEPLTESDDLPPELGLEGVVGACV